MLKDNLKQFRKEKGLTQEQLATILREKYGLQTDRAIISKWEIGFQEPRIHTLRCLADLYGVTLDQLNDEHNERYTLNTPTITQDYITFPVLYDVAAGFDRMAEAIDDWEGETIDIPRSYIHGKKDDYAVIRVKGDSMYPDYKDGDKVLLKKQPTLDYSGQVGVLVYEDCATLKRVDFVMGEDWLIMRPINPNFPPQRIEGVDLETCRVVGVPKLLVRKIVD